MERREYLWLSSVGLSWPLVGCIGTSSSDDSETPSPTTSQGDDTRRTDAEPTDSPMRTRVNTPDVITSLSLVITDEGGGPEKKPDVDVRNEEARIVVTGTLFAGNACHEPVVENVEYEEGTSELSAGISVSRVDHGCPDSLGTDTYRLTMDFESELPSSVTITQRPRGDGEASTTTVRTG